MKTASILRPAAWAGLIALGLGTQAALAEPLVYVPLGGEGKIIVADAAKDEIVNTISGVTAVHGLARTPDGKFLVAGSFEEREAGGAAPKKPAGMSAEEHAAHHSAAPAGAKKDGAAVSTVSVIRTADGSVVRRIEVPGAVHHVAVSPNGRYAVVTHPSEGAITAIDLASYEIAATLSTGPLANYAVFSPGSERVFISNAGNNTVSEVDTGSWSVRRNISAGNSPEHMVSSQDGQRLYVANADGGTVSAIATKDGGTVKTFEIGGALHGIDLSKDGNTLFVSALGQNKLVAIDLSTAKKREASVVPAPYHLASVGNTGKLYISSAEQPSVWVVDQKNLAVLGKISIGGKGHQMVLSPGS
ncbi:cytochrome D1 heme domain protein [bacterium BMS3Bbin10]|nr:cytochrome D1 heme domain protein [bacterium BMS3Bbin10]